MNQFSSVQSLSRVQLFVTPWTAAHQASLSITSSQSSPKLMCIKSVIPSSHLILCHPLLLSPSIFPSISVFSSELTLHIRWPKYCSISFSISPSNEYSGLIFFFRIDWFDLLVVLCYLNIIDWSRSSIPYLRNLQLQTLVSAKKNPGHKVLSISWRRRRIWVDTCVYISPPFLCLDVQCSAWYL